jgi:hypothetical protein
MIAVRDAVVLLLLRFMQGAAVGCVDVARSAAIDLGRRLCAGSGRTCDVDVDEPRCARAPSCGITEKENGHVEQR